MNQTIEQLRNTDKSSELIARLSNHMPEPNPLREAQNQDYFHIQNLVCKED